MFTGLLNKKDSKWIIYVFPCKNNPVFYPSTDEQAPIPGVFDEIVDRIIAIDSQTDVMFNCQMG